LPWDCFKADLVGIVPLDIVVPVGEDGTNGSSNTSTAKELECVRVKVNLRGPYRVTASYDRSVTEK
jgi:hypothetical protein